MEIKEQTETKIGMGSVVKYKVGKLQKITREVRIRRMRKEVVGCFHGVAGKKKFLVQFEYRRNKEISYSLLVSLSSKEEVDMDETISHSPEK